MERIVAGMLEILAVAVCAYVAGYQRAKAIGYKREQKENEQLEKVWQHVHTLPDDTVRQCLRSASGKK